jgi:hypothetical protein
MDTPRGIVWIIIILDDKGLKYSVVAKFVGYVGTNIKPLCVEFCNFVAVSYIRKSYKFLSVWQSECFP